MNLSEIPTPRTRAAIHHSRKRPYREDRERELHDFSRQLEREAAAWMAVAEMFAHSSNHAQEEFESLKAQLTKP